MGTLQSEADGARFALGTRTLIGRSPRCDLHLPEPVVSGEHAVITWTGSAWTLKDLASRNGTWVRGHKVDAGTECVLGAGDRVSFGTDGPGWSLASSSGPCPAASERDGAIIEAPDGLLALPNAEQPELIVSHHASEGWVAERGAEAMAVHNGEEVHASGRSFVLELPPRPDQASPIARTTEAGKDTGAFDMLALDFAVSRDEEYVELVAQVPEHSVTLKPRAHFYALLTLARLRLKDAEDPSLPASSHGWVHHEDLARMLALEPNVLNVQVFRARKQLAGAGFEDAARLVERRPGARQLRLGTGRIRIRTL